MKKKTNLKDIVKESYEFEIANAIASLGDRKIGNILRILNNKMLSEDARGFSMRT
jgi:hypothetical protein